MAWIKWMSEIMNQCLRVMKPGAHGLVWAIPRTSHWTATALEDAGFEVRDVVTHLFGSGFPKSLDVSKAIDKAAGVEREIVGVNPSSRPNSKIKNGRGFDGMRDEVESAGVQTLTAPATDSAKQWQGWGTALKPASEHWILIRKPCSEKTVAANVQKWGTGAINIDASRVEGKLDGDPNRFAKTDGGWGVAKFHDAPKVRTEGRFPANLVFSHSPHCTDTQCDIECATLALDAQSGTLKSGGTPSARVGMGFNGGKSDKNISANTGGASRFFYCAKISTSERNAGLDGMEKKTAGIGDERPSGQSMQRLDGRKPREVQNTHPTVKPKKLMSYLIRMITPPNGTVLDPFMGSGSTGIAAKECGFEFIGIEKEQEYFEIAKARIEAAT